MKIKTVIIHLMSFSGNLLEKLWSQKSLEDLYSARDSKWGPAGRRSGEMLLLSFQPPYLVTQWQWRALVSVK
jgi:hypothetical protein